MNVVSPPSESPAAPQSLFKKRASKNSAAIRKRLPTPPLSKDFDSSSEDSSAEEGQQKIKRRRTNGVVTAISEKVSKHAIADLEPTKYTADRSGEIDSVNDATKQLNWFDEEKFDAKSLLGRASTRHNTNSTHPTPAGDDDGLYKGSSRYANFITKNPNAPSRQVGPLKAPTNIRTITVTDFAPDVCKDYKQTGFCGFGDSCKFLHAREDYKQGWELDRDWEIGTQGKRQQQPGTRRKNEERDDEDDNAALDNIPFACIICKESYTSPVITRCGHYFCEKCALQRYRRNPACAACGTGTGGVFNIAKNLKKLLDKKRERAKMRRQKALEDCEEVEDDIDDDDEGGSGRNENLELM